MPRSLKVTHTTRYDYAAPVRFGPHRMLFRPRDSHDMRLLHTGLTINPLPSTLRWIYDVFGNSVAIAEFEGVSAAQLTFASTVTIETYEVSQPIPHLEAEATRFPIIYPASEMPDLAPFTVLNRPDDGTAIAAWAQQFADSGTPLQILKSMMTAIKGSFAYRRRDEEGTQTAADTLRVGSGTCRDFALLMIDAARCLGFAARFVTGYIHSPGLRGGAEVVVGGGATHAWVQVYLNGVGWIDVDPTNAIIGNRDLIRVAVARSPEQAAPLSGSWYGFPNDYRGLHVTVEVDELPR